MSSPAAPCGSRRRRIDGSETLREIALHKQSGHEPDIIAEIAEDRLDARRVREPGALINVRRQGDASKESAHCASLIRMSWPNRFSRSVSVAMSPPKLNLVASSLETARPQRGTAL
jgi:hypothetical protein